MLADRHYMRERGERAPLPLAVTLMIVLVAAFLLQCLDVAYLHTRAIDWLALTADGLKSGYLWQLITFQFLHANFWHLAGNLLGIWFFGRYVEHVMGKSRFLLAYLGAGVAGGLLQGILMLAAPQHFGGLLYGASAGVAGVFTIFALRESEAELRLYFLLPVRARTLLMFFAGISIFFTVFPSARDNTAHAAHLGGIWAGWAFVRLGWHHDYQPLPWSNAWSRVRAIFHRSRRGKPAQRGWPPWFDSLAGRRQPLGPPPAELDDAFIGEQVDAILDKISARGIHSLTEQERNVLERAREKMSKR